MLRELIGCKVGAARLGLQGWGCKVGHGTKPSASPTECSGSDPNADRHCCIDLSLVRGLRLAGETRGAGPRAPASRRAGKNGTGLAGRRCAAGQIRVQRRDDFNVAIWLPRQHGARPAPARTARRPNTCQFRAHCKPAPGGRDALNQRRVRKKPIPFLNPDLNTAEVGRLPKRVMLYIKPPPWGHVAEWLRNGLQNQSSRPHWHLEKPYTAGVSLVRCHKVPALTGTKTGTATPCSLSHCSDAVLGEPRLLWRDVFQIFLGLFQRRMPQPLVEGVDVTPRLAGCQKVDCMAVP
jgi:hypothetical protein